MNSTKIHELVPTLAENVQKARNIDTSYSKEPSLKNSESKETENESNNASEMNLKFRTKIKCKGRPKTRSK